MRQLEPTKNGYEEGLAAGKKVAGSWTPGGTTLLAKWKKTLLEAPQALLGGKDETELVRELDKWTREDQLACAADLHRRKLDAFPDVKRFPEIAGMDQYQEEYPKGYADEAGIDVREVYLGNYWRDLFFHVMKGGSLASQGGACSEAFFPKTPHGPMVGNGRDDTMSWYTDDPFGTSWPPSYQAPAAPETKEVGPQDEGKGYRVNETINEAGLCRENGGGALYEFEPVRDEVYFPVDVLDLVLRCCDTTLEAVELLTRYNLYWGPCNCVIGDAEGTGALIEKSTYHYAVRLSDRQVMVSTYGGCDDEDLRKLCDQTTPYFKYYERRLVVMKQVLAQAEAGDGLNLQAMWDCMLHHDPEAPGCQHIETLPTGVELFTHEASAWYPAKGWKFKRRFATENGTVRWPCSVPDQETRWRFV